MYLHQLRIWNFRKFGTSNESAIDLDNAGLVVNFNKNLNVLVGENDSGKTAIIDAIKHVLLTKSHEYIHIDDKDFHKEALELKIECIFKGFDVENKESSNFLEWIGFDDGKEYELKVWLYSSRKDNRITTDIRAGADNEGSQLDGSARNLLRTTYLKPLRDALAELTPGHKSRFSQILKSHDVFRKKGDELHPLENAVEDANEIINNYFKEELDELEGKKENGEPLKRKINEYLNGFFGTEKSTSIQISESNLSDILNQLSLTFDEKKSGLGSLNLLFIAAELLLLGTEYPHGLQLALIEEIEAHLHAQAQLRLIKVLQEKEHHQFILTTHSITLASKINLESLIICRNNKAFPMGYPKTQLEKGDYKFLERFLDATKANLFFAKGVIIVEGDAENLLIPTIAEIIDKPLHKYGVSIVNVGSIAFKRYVKIFLRKDLDDDEFKKEWLDIPVAIVTDIDERPLEYYDDPDNNNKEKGGYVIKEENISELEAITKDVNFENLKGSVYTSVIKLQNAISKECSGNLKKDIRKKITTVCKFDRITSCIIDKLKESRHKSMLEENKSQNVRAFVTKNWTLEYEFALSDLNKEFYEAVLRAEWIQNKNSLELEQKCIEAIQEECNAFFDEAVVDSKSLDDVAYSIYKPLIRSSNKVSKAITAQCFAEVLKEQNKGEIKAKLEKKDSPLNYLCDAIIYATTGKHKEDERS